MLDSSQRDALANSPAINIPTGAKEAVWAALAPQLGAGPSASAARLAVQGAASKAWLALPALVGLGAIAFFGLRHPSAHPPALALPSVAAPVLLAPPVNNGAAPVAPNAANPAVITPSAADTGAPASSPAPEASTHHRAAAPSSADLEREIALLAQARAQLRAGNAAGAQATLSQMQSQFPDRALHQERQVLKILAQNALGNRESARRSALAFIKAHPESPHDAQLQRMMAQP